MSSWTKRVFFDDYVFVVDENVYEPAEDSFLFAENFDVKEGERVLDMGTGCGILGMIASKKAGEVVAVDVNPFALRCARDNALLNNVRGKLAFLRSDLFTAFTEKAMFNVVLFNAPYLKTERSAEDSSWLERAWTGGRTGREIIDRFISEVPKYLKSAGRVFLLQSTQAGVDETLLYFKKCRLSASVVASRPLPFFETITLIEATT